MKMACILNFIILLAVSHHSYSFQNQQLSKLNPQFRYHQNPQNPSNEKQQMNYGKQQNYEKQEMNYGKQQIGNEKQRTSNNYQTNNEKGSVPINHQHNSAAAPRRYRYDVGISSEQGNQPNKPTRSEKVWRFELDIPEIMRSLKKITGVSVSDDTPKKRQDQYGILNQEDIPRAREDGFLSQKLRFEVRPPNLASLLGYMSSFINLQQGRRFFNRVINGYVENGPGVTKTPAENYPPRFYEKILTNLVRLKRLRKLKGQKF